MKYLFFDCEFANCFDSKEKICEFGYVMVNENFNVLYKGNIIINPIIKDNEWDWYALKKILTRKRKEYKNRLFFPAYHKKIVALIQNADCQSRINFVQKGMRIFFWTNIDYNLT